MIPPGSDQGVAAGRIKIAIILVNVVGPAGNSTFGLATADQQKQYYQEVIDATNASGGVACAYKISPLYYQANPVDLSNLQQICLSIEQAGVFAVVDYGAYFEDPSLAQCYPDSHIPYFGIAQPPQAEQQRLYPYLFSTGSTLETLYHNSILALSGRGFFSSAHGFRKLGFVYHDCIPEVIPEILGWLHQVGVSSSQLATYNLGCPSPFAPPSTIEQAVLKFQQEGVTNVTQAQAATDLQNFTTVAEQQNFRPRYGFPDDSVIALSEGSEHPNYNNIANALAISGSRFGEENTPGLAPNRGTVLCNSVFAAHGQPSVYHQSLGAGGSACDDLWLLFGAINHAATLHRDALAAGLQAAHSIELSYPYGPNDFSGLRVTTGSEFWRPLQFFTACDCWRVLDPTFHPSFR